MKANTAVAQVEEINSETVGGAKGSLWTKNKNNGRGCIHEATDTDKDRYETLVGGIGEWKGSEE